MKMKYEDFVASKRRSEVASGHSPDVLNEHLFDFQHAIVSWAVRRGRAAIFADTGLGKTLMQLSWADEVARHTGGRVLILAPLAVSEQTIEQGRTLNRMPAREDEDSKHMCPLQLDVIERCIHLWTNPGDLVFSPFTGIGSEGYCALRMGRKFLGTELKPRYWELACQNIADGVVSQGGLFA